MNTTISVKSEDVQRVLEFEKELLKAENGLYALKNQDQNSDWKPNKELTFCGHTFSILLDIYESVKSTTDLKKFLIKHDFYNKIFREIKPKLENK